MFKLLVLGLSLSIATSSFAVEATKTFNSVRAPDNLPEFKNGVHYKFRVLADQINYPWSIASLTNNGYIVSLRSGSLHLLDKEKGLSAAIAGVPDTYVRSQGGFFDVLPDREFGDELSPHQNTIYLAFAFGKPKENATRVIKAHLNLEALALENLEPVITVSPFKDTPVHYGGRLLQLDDGTLLVVTGDGFQYREAAQDPFSQLGKTLRFNRDGSVPADNPYADGKEADPYVYSLGHRSPQGLVLASDGRIFMNEHGPRGGDEINLVAAGGNYGWPKTTHGVNYSGALVSPYTELPGVVPPLLHWTPSIAPSGLAFYEGDLLPALRGCLLSGGLVSRDVRCAKLDGNSVVAEYSLFGELGQRIRDVRVSPSGSLLLLTDSDKGRVIEGLPIGP